MKSLFSPVMGCLVLSAGLLSAEPVRVAALRCEYLINPLGVEGAAPRLSWRIDSAERGQRQTAYQVLAASTGQKLAGGEGDLWDSGKVAGDQTRENVERGSTLLR